MKIAIISDIHENAHNLVSALEMIEELGAEHVLCLGDLVNAGIAKLLAHAPVPVSMVWGNNDGDKTAITKASLSEGSKLSVARDCFDVIKLAGKKIFFTHYPMLARTAAKSGEFDAVFYGHTHLKHQTYEGECLVVNPGEIGGARTGEATFAVYDSDRHSAEFFVVEDKLHLKSDKVEGHKQKLGLRSSKTDKDKY